MRVIFSIQHPAHVHLFRNAISELQAEGHAVRIYVREKDVAVELLERYEIPHVVLAGEADSLAELAFVELKYEFRLTRAARRFDPDVMVAMGGVGISRPAKLSGAKCLVFTDTEHATLQNLLAFPFADRICTPDCYRDDAGSKQVRYPGYHELAYLHPNRFSPDPTVFDDLGCDPEDKIVLLRLVSWGAAHDIGDGGFADVSDVVDRLEATGAHVLITSEEDLPDELEEQRASIPVDRIHDLMYYADLFVGESATMATESAVLGTPAIFVSTSHRGYTDELEERYGLVFTYSDERRQRRAIEKAISILKSDPGTWERRRQQLLKDKIDTTEFIVDQVYDMAGHEQSDASTLLSRLSLVNR